MERVYPRTGGGTEPWQNWSSSGRVYPRTGGGTVQFASEVIPIARVYPRTGGGTKEASFHSHSL